MVVNIDKIKLIMLKNSLEKQLQKMQRASEKQAKDQLHAANKQAQESRRANISESIINSFNNAQGFMILNQESESLLAAILNQYDGNDRFYIKFDPSKLPIPVKDAASQYYDVLKQIGFITNYINYGNECLIWLSYSGLSYFENKVGAEQKEKAETDRKNQLETDLMAIQGMNNDQLRQIYIEAVQANYSLRQSIVAENKQIDELKKQNSTAEAQLQVLHNIFVSQEDGVSVEKEIMKYAEQIATPEQMALLKDKSADVIVGIILLGIQAWFKAHGVVF